MPKEPQLFQPTQNRSPGHTNDDGEMGQNWMTKDSAKEKNGKLENQCRGNRTQGR